MIPFTHTEKSTVYTRFGEGVIIARFYAIPPESKEFGIPFYTIKLEDNTIVWLPEGHIIGPIKNKEDIWERLKESFVNKSQ